MSLFSSLQLANNSLLANQIGLQTVSQNIANVNTPNYSRAEVQFVPGPSQKDGSVLLGSGVQVSGVVQRIDSYLEQRLRNATSDRVSGEAQESAYKDLEGVLNVLSDNGLDSSINSFFASINEVLNQPDSVSNRNLAVLQGQTLAQDIRNLYSRVQQLRTDLDTQIQGATSDANRLIEQVRNLNVQISNMEGGGTSKSDAVGLRDQRNKALADLSQLIGIDVREQDSSSANVFVGGEFLVFEGTSRTLSTKTTAPNGLQQTDVQFADTKSSLARTGGKISGLVTARDNILSAFLDKLNQYSQTLTFEFNKVFSSGQGLKGYSSVTSERGVVDSGAPLESAGLAFTPISGNFQILVKNSQTGLTQTSNISVDLNGLGNDDTSLLKLRQQIDAVDGISATITPTGQLSISSDSPINEFSFAGDTSGVLAALGINTFFTGTKASDIGISATIANDPRLFAASQGGTGTDAKNAIQLAGFLDRPLDTLNGETITELHDRLIANVTENSSAAQSVADGLRSYEGTLKGQQLAISGVSLDEEAVQLMSYQRAYQASARFIAAINQILDTLVQI